MVALSTMTLFMSTALDAASPRRPSIYHDGWIDFNKNGVKDVYEDPSKSIDERVEDLLSRMNMDEKTCQLTTLYGYKRVLNDSLPTAEWKNRVWKDGIANIDEQLNGVGSGYTTSYDLIYPFSNHVEALHKIQKFFVEETRLGIPAEFTNEGIHGLNHTKATPLPAPIGIGSTWNRELVRQAGQIAGYEARLIGYHSVYAPILDVARDQRWGRVVECYGEDPYLVAQLGTEMASGVQSQGVASCMKHFAAYGVPKGGRDGECRTDPHINPRDLHQIFLYPFAEVIRNSHPMEVMSSYNDWNGDPVSSSHYFLTELLRDTYGFDGYVVSDSHAVEYIYNKHHVAATYEEAVAKVIEAGLNVRTNFTQPEDFTLALRAAYAQGLVSEEAIDRRVREVLSVKFRLGLFNDPYSGDGILADKYAGADAHEDFIMDMGRQSVVLLKNQGDILPLDTSSLRKVLVTGPLADESDFMFSRYGPNGLDPVTMLSGLRSYLGDSVNVMYEKGCDVVDPNFPESEIMPFPFTASEEDMMQAALTKAAEADVIIAVLGENDKIVGESHTRTSLDLPGHQRELLMRLQATGKPVVLVLINGRPLTVNWADAHVPAILEMWFPTCLGGHVLAQTLFGENNPSGKLTVTFPKTVGQIEYNFPFKKGSHGDQPRMGPNGNGTTRVVGALYPFGYGLSYTSFEYSDMEVEKRDGGVVKVRCNITNTGRRAGAEVVQLYVRDMVSSFVAYDSMLRGFEKVTLEPGQTKRVSFTLTPESFQMLDKDMKWVVEPGEFEIRIGAGSEDIRLRKTINL